MVPLQFSSIPFPQVSDAAQKSAGAHLFKLPAQGRADPVLAMHPLVHVAPN
jgi:hypothetical protein